MTVIEAVSASSFRHAVWLYPVATALHVREEWPGFPVWVRRFGSARYTDREYVITHALTIGLALSGSAAVAVAPRPALVFGPAVLWNACFHLGATLVSRTYCPGAVTGAVLYLPLGAGLALLAIRDGLLSPALLAMALGVALVGHVAEVGRTVFKRW